MHPSKKYPRGFEHRTRVAFDQMETVPQTAGVYVWKFDGVDGLEHWTYHYVGKASNLHADLAAQVSSHSKKSVLRQKLAALLQLPAKRGLFGGISMKADTEARLSEWMRTHGSCWFYETRSLGSYERAWIKGLQAPMNCERGSDPLGLKTLHASLGRRR